MEGKTRTNLVGDDPEPFDFDRRSRAPFDFDRRSSPFDFDELSLAFAFAERSLSLAFSLLLAIVSLSLASDRDRLASVNLVDWLKMMVGSRRSDEVVDPTIEIRPSTSALKRALLTSLRCVDSDAAKRPKMGQVVRMLESEEYPIPREDRRRRRNDAVTIEVESQMENSDTDKSDNPVLRSDKRRSHRA
ncbi:hypothetical protein TEA_028705 [Camellia sinensis var. sinensis]|uniref:non-specific serine/threonine protein kinase n=1 Tax=Camellia sinensis var. sinensis TaxID=542762 RepID=A0A4S4F1R3_CAMSN|nr:hypothetical protein TEA_028705 [Camellia sinensis var. sinensis]